MFKGIQNILNKVSHKGAEPIEPGALPVMRAGELLAPEKHQQALQKLPEILNLDSMKFDSHCATLIDEFAEFVQLLPETQNSYFAKPGGILEHGLHRAVLGASMCRAYFLPKDSGKENLLTQQQVLWTYAVFTAGLLHDIGKVAVDLTVTLFDRYTDTSKPWILWEGSMVGAATDYKYEFSGLNLDDFRRRATLIIARQLLPEQSFLWLASDADVFAAWLAMLQDDERASGIIGRILPLADAEIIKKYFLENKTEKKAEVKSDKKQDVKLSDVASTFSKTKKTGEMFVSGIALTSTSDLGKEFLSWAQDAIEKGKIKANQQKDGVIHVQEGVLLTQQVFEKFLQETGTQIGKGTENKNWKAVAEAVAGLKLHEQNAKEPVIQQYAEIGKEGANIQGIVIKNVNMLFPQTLTPEVHQNFVRVPIGAVLSATAQAQIQGQPSANANMQADNAQPTQQQSQQTQQPTPPSTNTPGSGIR